MANPTLDWVVRQIEQLRTTMTSRSTAPQLAYSSFDSGRGHGIEETDPVSGNPVASYGTQFDGSHGAVAYVGPVPPTPTEAVVGSGPELLVAGWDGYFVNADGAPDETVTPTLDFSHVEVHASMDPNFTAEFADTIINVISTARGGTSSVVAQAGNWYVRLVARTTTGKRSAASAPVMTTVTVMQNTTPAGYTSEVTGRGLRVFRTVDGKTIDIIRLGTFGTDYLGISDNNGMPLTSLTGYGDVGAKAIYADKQLYAAGRNVDDTLASLPQGIVGTGAGSFATGGWAQNSTAPRGVLELAFDAEPGRAYEIEAYVELDFSDVRSRGQLLAWYVTSNQNPPARVTVNSTQIGAGQPFGLMDAGDRVRQRLLIPDFVPIAATVSAPSLVRVLIGAQRTHTAGNMRVYTASVGVKDAGFRNRRQFAGVTNGLTLTDPTTLKSDTQVVTATMPLTAVHHFKRDAAGAYLLQGTITDPPGLKPIKQGILPDGVWKTQFSFGSLPERDSIVSIEDMRLIMTPAVVPEGFGTLILGQNNGNVINSMQTTGYPDENWVWNIYPYMELGAWPEGVTREFVFSKRMIERHLFALSADIDYVAGSQLPDALLSTQAKYGVQFPNHQVKLQVRYRKAV